MAVSKLNPYINFKAQAKEALEFYKSCLGGEVKMSTFKEGGMSHGPSSDDLIMHGQLDVPNGILLMCSDVPDDMSFQPGGNIQISISGDNKEELQGYWDKLTQGGKITMPYTTAPWGDTFGMFKDKFGIDWMINCSGDKQA